MKPQTKRRRRSGAPGLQFIEQAVGLLRENPEALLFYWIGGVPFWLGLLYYLSDMSRSAYAAAHIAEASFGVALLFLWMKCWQTLAAGRLRATLLLMSPPPWTVGRLLPLILRQAALQPLGLVLRPIAIVVTLPFVWVSSFFQNLTVLGSGGSGDPTDPTDQPSLFSRSLKQARLWPGQQHAVVALLNGFGFLIWINVIAALIFLPVAMKMFFGWETVFTRSADAYLNVTVFMASVALTHLCLEPIWKATYVLRCFYGESLRTGGDLVMELKRLQSQAGRAVLVMLCIGLGWGALCPHSSVAAAPTATEADAARLDERIGDVLERREFAWRAPRVESPKASKSGGWLSDAGKAIERWLTKARDAVERLFKRWFSEDSNEISEARSWGSWAPELLWGLLALVAIALAIALIRGWHRRPAVIQAQAAVVPVDLCSEALSADALPEDAWLQLAREHAARGDLQLALRAAWLACLAHLGGRDLLRIAAFKSNREYEGELRRRARTRAGLLSAFADNLISFERCWYGRHAVSPEAFEIFHKNLEQIRGC